MVNDVFDEIKITCEHKMTTFMIKSIMRTNDKVSHQKDKVGMFSRTCCGIFQYHKKKLKYPYRYRPKVCQGVKVYSLSYSKPMKN